MCENSTSAFPDILTVHHLVFQTFITLYFRCNVSSSRRHAISKSITPHLTVYRSIFHQCIILYFNGVSLYIKQYIALHSNAVLLYIPSVCNISLYILPVCNISIYIPPVCNISLYIPSVCNYHSIFQQCVIYHSMRIAAVCNISLSNPSMMLT